jgi:hypothetical protein
LSETAQKLNGDHTFQINLKKMQLSYIFIFSTISALVIPKLNLKSIPKGQVVLGTTAAAVTAGTIIGLDYSLKKNYEAPNVD